MPGKSTAAVEEDEDLIGVSDDGGLLLYPLTEVDAVCRTIKTVTFRMYRRTKMVMTFDVVSPDELLERRVSLKLFVRIEPWRRIPTSSKLYKIACVALGHRLRQERITKSLFIGKIFRCRLRSVGTGPTAYSVIETLTERLSGGGTL